MSEDDWAVCGVVGGGGWGGTGGGGVDRGIEEDEHEGMRDQAVKIDKVVEST